MRKLNEAEKEKRALIKAAVKAIGETVYDIRYCTEEGEPGNIDYAMGRKDGLEEMLFITLLTIGYTDHGAQGVSNVVAEWAIEYANKKQGAKK